MTSHRCCFEQTTSPYRLRPFMSRKINERAATMLSRKINKRAATMLSCFVCGSHSVVPERTSPFMTHGPSSQEDQQTCPASHSLILQSSHASHKGFSPDNGSSLREPDKGADTSLSSSLQDEELKLVISSVVTETEQGGEAENASEEQGELVESGVESSEEIIGESSVPRRLPHPNVFGDSLKMVHQCSILEEGMAVHKRVYDEIDEADKGSYAEPEKTLDVGNEDYGTPENRSSIHGNKASVGSLFSYKLSEMQRDWAFLSAGLVIQAVGFQLTSMVEVVTTIVSLLNVAGLFVSHAVHKVSLVQKKLVQGPHFAQYVMSFEERWAYLKPWLKTGAKKAGRSCLTAACLLSMLCALVITSFLLSYFFLRRSSSMRHKPIHVTKALYFDYTKSHPVASLDLNPLVGSIKYPRSCSALVPSSVNHLHSTIFLTLPESDHNRQLGVFQVASELVSGENGKVLIRASQPCMLHFKNHMLQYMKSILMLVPLLAGAASEAQTLGLELPQWATPQGLGITSSNLSLRVMLMPRAGRPVSVGLPELYKADVHLELSSWRTPPRAHSLRSNGNTFISFICIGCILFSLLFGCLLILYMFMKSHNKF